MARQRSKFRLSHKIRETHEEYGKRPVLLTAFFGGFSDEFKSISNFAIGPIIRIGPNDLHFASPSALKQIYSHGRESPRKGAFYDNADLVSHKNLFSFMYVEIHSWLLSSWIPNSQKPTLT